MQQNNQPVKGAPKRSFMPQTDTSNNWSSFLKNGEVNFIEPDVLKSDLKEHYMRILKEYRGDVPQAVEKMYIFDFDDTIAETHSMVYVKDTRDNTERPMNSVEFRSYKKLPHEQFDFREFAEVVDPKELEQVIKAFSDILLAMKDAESQERVFLCILTARGPQGGRTSRNIKNYLKDLFTKFLTGIDSEDLIAEWNDILENFTVEALGANRAEDKSRWILDKANLFPNLKKVVFYDDAPKNREAFEMMQDELQTRGVETITHDPAGYTYDPEHLEEDKEVTLQENKILDRMKVLAGIKKNR
jgi:hypothetical protein